MEMQQGGTRVLGVTSLRDVTTDDHYQCVAFVDSTACRLLLPLYAHSSCSQLFNFLVIKFFPSSLSLKPMRDLFLFLIFLSPLLPGDQ